MTTEEYERNIPSCCMFQTYKDHFSYLALCWGITIRMVTKDSFCGRECPEHKEHDPELLQAILDGRTYD